MLETGLTIDDANANLSAMKQARWAARDAVAFAKMEEDLADANYYLALANKMLLDVEAEHGADSNLYALIKMYVDHILPYVKETQEAFEKRDISFKHAVSCNSSEACYLINRCEDALESEIRFVDGYAIWHKKGCKKTKKRYHTVQKLGNFKGYGYGYNVELIIKHMNEKLARRQES